MLKGKYRRFKHAALEKVQSDDFMAKKTAGYTQLLEILTGHAYNKVKNPKNISDHLMKKLLTENLELYVG